jgi:hypothetical protein
MTKDQPDLFDTEAGAKRPAVVIAFPLDRDVRRVRHVARLFLSKQTDKAREAYWRSSVCQKLFATLVRNGIDDDQAHRQLEAFRLAVGIEMDHLMNGTREQA